MISAIAWVPKGASRRVPEKLKLTDAEMKLMHQLAADEAAEEREQMEAAMADVALDDEDDNDGDDSDAAVVDASATDRHGLPASFKMDEYDDEDDDAAITNFIGHDVLAGEHADSDNEDVEENDGESENDDAEGEQDMAVDDEDDDDDDEEEDPEDKEDVEILPTDAVVLVASTEEEFSNLEVHVYDEDNGSLYIHHEINLPAFPLCLAWIDCAPTPVDAARGPVDGSFVAVGTFKPGIEIWNLDVLDVLEPSATLGGEESDALRDVAMPPVSKRRKNKQVTLKPGSHQDAVMSLDWNSSHRNMLASGSADTTVKVWDITTQTCLYTMGHHAGKVQSVRWNPEETTVLASAAFDRTVVVLDCRAPDAFAKFALSADVESLAWAPHAPSTIVAATEDGVVTVKIWDLADNKPVCITSKDMNVGELFSMSFYRDAPYMLAVGGSKGTLALWDTSENEGVERRFGSRAQGLATPVAGATDISASFKSAFDLGEELARQEEAEREQQHKPQQKAGKKKAGKSKGKKRDVKKIKFDSLGQQMGAADTLGRLFVWKFNNLDCESCYRQIELLISGGEGGSISVFDVQQRRVLHTTLELHPSGHCVLSGSASGDVKIWSLPIFREVTSLSKEPTAAGRGDVVARWRRRGRIDVAS
ncbi:hypothetical protein PybrP1_004206 [[Pythium] brassicae (nom. inval.)]|nr:hypothetical protein PybrP1_004206 [[Pythium] brassicae (nom. inval.)]